MRYLDRKLAADFAKNIEFDPKVACKIKAETVKRLLLQAAKSSDRNHAALRLRGVPATATEPAKSIFIVGKLNLRDGFGAEGGPLPPFVATNCRFVEDDVDFALASIDLARASLERLSLRGSAFARLRANHCFIAGDCDLSAEFGADMRRGEICQLRMDGAEIAGSLILSGRCFGELAQDLLQDEIRTLRPPFYRNCAIDLSNARIGRDLQIVRPTINGLLNARGIVVEGNVRMMAVLSRPSCDRAASRSGKAVDFEYARVFGNVSIRAATTGNVPERMSAISGSLFFHAARIDGELIIEEGDFVAMGITPQSEQLVAINLAHATIGGNVRVGSVAAKGLTTFIGGTILLDYAMVGGGLHFRRVYPAADRQEKACLPCPVHAHGVTVEQAILIENCYWRADGTTTGIRYCALDFWKATVGLGIKIDQQSSVEGSVRINNAVISRGAMIRCNFVADCGKPEEHNAIDTRIDLASSRIDGDLRINAGASAPNASIRIDGAVSLNQTVVAGRTVLENIVFRYLKIPDDQSGQVIDLNLRRRLESERLSDNRRTILNLNSLEARGGLIVRNLAWEVLTEGRFESPPRIAGHQLPGWRPTPIRRDVITDPDLAIIDARGMQCVFLNDDHGEAWKLHRAHYMRLDQVDIGRIEEGDGHHLNEVKRNAVASSRNPTTSKENKIRLRLMFLAHQAPKIEILADALRTHFIWWRTAFFTPQPYDNFARAYIRRGDLGVGRRLLIRRTDIERWRQARNIFAGLLPQVWQALGQVRSWHATRRGNQRPSDPQPERAAWTARIKFHAAAIIGIMLVPINIMLSLAYTLLFRAYRLMFGYGLEPARAVWAMAGFIAVGVVGTMWARSGNAADIRWPFVSGSPTTAASWTIRLRSPVTFVPAGAPALIKAVPDWPIIDMRTASQRMTVGQKPQDCDIDSLSYAVDAFIPLLDMKFEAACKIADDPMKPDRSDPYRGWRWALLLYEIAGWIVTSLTILTISGVIRRDVDK